jgi:hypothetical protein
VDADHKSGDAQKVFSEATPLSISNAVTRSREYKSREALDRMSAAVREALVCDGGGLEIRKADDDRDVFLERGLRLLAARKSRHRMDDFCWANLTCPNNS